MLRILSCVTPIYSYFKPSSNPFYFVQVCLPFSLDGEKQLVELSLLVVNYASDC